MDQRTGDRASGWGKLPFGASRKVGMNPRIQSLHHVTATVNDAREDVDFYTRVLGLRLVKKTVNFDNHHVFHFYYGDEVGHPGTLFTTFPYQGKGVRVGRKGAGQITATAFSVPPGSLPTWRRRLESHGVPLPAGASMRFGEEVLGFEDPSGLTIELIATAADRRSPWSAPGMDPAMAIRGLHSVTLTIAIPEPSFDLLAWLGYTRGSSEQERTRFSVGVGGPGHLLDLLEAPDAPVAQNGLGTVHHVAMSVATAEDQLEYRKALVRRGVPVTEVMDRQYFQSIYFREPGGVLCEIATAGPGFLIDERREQLGTGLKLPPWEEPSRSVIEAGLPVLQDA
jgi:glyoxalase family protein